MGMPTYKGTNPGRAPSAVSFVMFIFKRCVVISCPLGPHRMLSSAAHVINVGESGPVQLACAFRALIVSRNKLVDTMAVALALLAVFMSMPSGFWALLMTRLLKRSMSSSVHCRVRRLL